MGAGSTSNTVAVAISSGGISRASLFGIIFFGRPVIRSGMASLWVESAGSGSGTLATLVLVFFWVLLLVCFGIFLDSGFVSVSTESGNFSSIWL